MQEHSTTYRIEEPSKDPFALHLATESTIWDLQDTEAVSNSSEWEDDGYTSTDSAPRRSNGLGGRHKSAIGRAKQKVRRPHRPQHLEHVHRHEFDKGDDDDPSTSLKTPVSPQLKSYPAAPGADPPALDNVWELLDTWYMHKGHGKRPPCAVEQSRLDQLHFIGTRENACSYLDRQGNEFSVTACPLRGWEERGLYIIVAFRDDQEAMIIMGDGSRDKKKRRAKGVTTFPFYIWQGITGDEEGWEREPSICKVVRYSNPTFYEPTNLKKRRIGSPKSSQPSHSIPEVRRAPKPPRQIQPLLSESFPDLFAQLNKWMSNDPSEKDPAFVFNNQPDLYLSKTHPEQQIRYVDVDGGHVEAALYSIGVGNKHVIVAHSPILEPALISFDSFPKLPKYYSAYYKWTSTKSWIEPPCVFKAFGAGPFEPPRVFVKRAQWYARVHPPSQGKSFITTSTSAM
jgi:hypothetical protein